MRQRTVYGEMTWSASSRSRRAPHRGTHYGRNAGLLVALLYLLVSAGVATATVRVMHSHSHPRVLALLHRVPPAKYLVLMVLDGGRPDYLDLTSLPHVDALRSHGIQFTQAFDGILESETPAGHTTLATGSSPARNGILGFDWAQNDNDYSLFSPDVVRAGAMEHIMESAGVPTLAGLYKARYPTAKVVALSGHKYYAADPLGGPQADAIMYYQGDPQGHYVPVAIPGHTPPAGVLDAKGLIGPSTTLPYGAEDTLATKLALAAFAQMHQRMTLINYPEFDWPLGHVDGGSADRAKVITLMQGFDRDLGKIEAAYRKAGILQQTLFVITADHGMAPVVRFIPQSVITNAVAAAGTRAPAISFNSAAYVWLSDPTKAQTVAANILKTNDPGVQSVYYRTIVAGKVQYVRAGGSLVSSTVDAANRYLLQTLVNGHEPAVVAFSKTNQSFSDPSSHWKGDHGGASWQSQHIPLIIAGPNVPPGVVSNAPAQLEDVAPTVLSLMAAPSTGMEGRVLTEALDNPSARAAKSRSAEVKKLSPLVQALISQDNYELTH